MTKLFYKLRFMLTIFFIPCLRIEYLLVTDTPLSHCNASLRVNIPPTVTNSKQVSSTLSFYLI